MGVFFSHPKKNRTFGSFIPYSLRISGQIAELVQSLFLGNIMSPHETVDVLSNLLVQVATASMFARQLFGYVFLQRTPQPVEALSAMCFHDSAGRFLQVQETSVAQYRDVCKCKKHQLRSTEMCASATYVNIPPPPPPPTPPIPKNPLT